MKARSLIIPFILSLLFAGAAASTRASVLTVSKTADTADGVCDSDCSLREAVAASASGDTIVFSDLFNTPQTITLVNGHIQITQSLAVIGPGSGLLSISGNDADRIFFVLGGQSVMLVLTGMHLRNARNTFSGFGGAIYFEGGSLTVSNMIFSNNYALFVGTSQTFSRGSAISGFQSSINISGSSFHNNTATRDGGTVDVLGGSINISNSSFSSNAGSGAFATAMIHASDSSFHDNSGQGISGTNLNLERCTITHNRDGGVDSSGTLAIDHSTISFNERFNSRDQAGGGIYNAGEAVIRNTSIANNSVNGHGAGIRNIGIMYVKDSSIVNNEAGLNAGGIYNTLGAVFLTNTTVSGNRGLRGAGVYNEYNATNPGARIYLTNSTVAFNRSTIGPGGIVNEPGAIVRLGNSIVNKNTRNDDLYDISGAVISQGFNIIGPPNDSDGWLAKDMVGVIFPMLAPLGHNGGTTLTHALRPKSPAMNGGSIALAVDPLKNTELVADQRGSARNVGGTVDIGAYEASFSSSPVSLAGRVMTPSGRGIAGSRVRLSGESGAIRFAITNPFGFYRFINLPVGETYTITSSDKLYTFASPITLTTDQDRDDLIFLGMF